ncbi:RNA helicase [Ameyamaea chiangmaiensis NBRC 103196]|nr:DEAD/DEAH box helicase [Ameyamaea chiangmaiensis]GBQ72376.1 RNA helicase [Ameyamaea chiangmaiensis NBRC 103196]
MTAPSDAAARKPRSPRPRKAAATPRARATKGTKAAPKTQAAPDDVTGTAPDVVIETHPAHVAGALAGESLVVTADEPTPAPDVVPETVAADGAQEGTDAPAEPALPLFSDLGLCAPLQRAIDEMGYTHPTPIQAMAIPYVLAGQDVLGVAQTGTGKTASFTLPMLEILHGSRARARMPRSLILEPTRELALQVAENFVLYGKHLRLTHALLIGGESMAEQKEALNRGVDVLIATPGRLLDLFERGGLLLTQTRVLVIDEADRMLDMGFIPDIERIVSLLSPMRQTLLFSATMAPEIRRLADTFMRSPKEVTVSRPSSVATTIETGLLVVNEDDKRRALRKLLRAQDVQNAIVFCNRKRDVDMLYKSLTKHGFSAGALHGDLPQSIRFQTLEKFKAGELKILVCSDVAARGIDIGGLSHVFNFDVPFHAEDYVHRIGRTGRAGRTGHAYSLATPYERTLVDAIQTLIGRPIEPITVEGVEAVPFSEEPRPRHGGRDKDRKGARKGRGRGDDRREETRDAAPAATRPAEAPSVESTPRAPSESQSRPPRERRPAPRPVEDQGAAFTGFGADVPAFMLLPHRTTPREAAAHHGEHG